MRHKVIGAVLFLALFSGCALLAEAQKLSPKLKKKEVSLRTFLLFPPKVLISRDSVKGTEGMLKESEEIEKAALKLVTNCLKERGFTVVESAPPAEAAGDEESRYTLADIQSKYDQLHTQVQSKQKDVEKGRFTLGEEVAKIHPPQPVDALIFIRGSGNVKTAGKAFLGALAGGGGVSLLLLSFGIVDARTGEVLYFDQRGVASGIVGKKFHEKPEEALKKPVDKAFKKVPPPALAAK